MTLADFYHSLSEDQPAKHWSVQLQSLWFDAKGDWKNAHDLVDLLEDRKSAHVHAYLHRVEGDQWNARYWYNRAKQPECRLDLKEERDALISSLLP
ncbi:hypothetical protein ACFRAE_02295 [Sphingobacterium sp. HJSM2_6]|uniref:hypothetical protein n=1 Tax=Sphingobacterium sp. HJSM2_6 TaxID=3366264 RepID=UPI003BDC2E4A